MLKGLIRHCWAWVWAVRANSWRRSLSSHRTARQDLEPLSPVQAQFEMQSVPARLCPAQNTEAHGILFASHLFLPPFPCIAKKENVIDTENHHLRGSLRVCKRRKEREKL